MPAHTHTHTHPKDVTGKGKPGDRKGCCATCGQVMAGTARLHTITLSNGDIQQFNCKWDGMHSLVTRRPPNDDLMGLVVLQFGAHLATHHGFFVEYFFWYNRPAVDATRSYGGLWTLVHDWVRRKGDTTNMTEAL